MAVRVANGQGFWGDWQEAPVRLVQQGGFDYLGLDYLAEITMSIMRKQMAKDPRQGYARDFVSLMRAILPSCKAKGIRVVTNAGGLNPQECRRQVVAVARQLGLSGVKVASVTGDDMMDRVPDLVAAGADLRNMDTGAPISDILDRMVSANAYLGGAPLAEALSLGADVVIAGRCSDPALVLGPLLHEYGWKPTDYDQIARGTIAGHLIECGAQVTGGNFEGGWWDIPDVANIGYPIAEIDADGDFTLSKPGGTGGRVTFHTVVEQLLYEMGDPANYIGPDVIADLTEVRIAEVGEDRVRVSGVRGKPPTPFYKVSAAYNDGFALVGNLVYSWPGALEKARVAADMLTRRLQKMGIRYDDIRVDFVGHSSIHGHLAPRVSGELPEIVMRVALRGQSEQDLVRAGMEFAPIALSGPAGATGFGGGRPRPSEIVEYWPTLVPKSAIEPVVEVEEV